MNRHVGVLRLASSDYSAEKIFGRDTISLATHAARERGFMAYFLSLRDPVGEACKWYRLGTPDLHDEAVAHAHRLLAMAGEIARELRASCQR